MNEQRSHTASASPITVESLCAQIEEINRGFEALTSKLIAERNRYRSALMLIAAKEGMTLLSNECADPERAFQLGANRAFNDCAYLAKEALTDEEQAHG
jgi:hypothetical protein